MIKRAPNFFLIKWAPKQKYLNGHLKVINGHLKLIKWATNIKIKINDLNLINIENKTNNQTL